MDLALPLFSEIFPMFGTGLPKSMGQASLVTVYYTRAELSTPDAVLIPMDKKEGDIAQRTLHAAVSHDNKVITNDLPSDNIISQQDGIVNTRG